MEHLTAKPTNKNEITEMIDGATFMKGIAKGGAGLVAIVRLPDMKLFFVNKQFEYYLGYRNGDLQSGSTYFTDLLVDYQQELLLNQLNNVKEDVAARVHFLIYQIKSKDGIVKPYYLYATPIPYEQKTTECFYHLLLIPDLSKWGLPFISFETKEIFLEQFKGEFFGTFEWIVEDDKVHWSEGVYNIYEVDLHHHKINNDFMLSFIHPHDMEITRAAIKNALEWGTALNVEFKIITAKLNVKILHCLAKVIENGEGKRVKIVGSIRDVTEQRSIEENLKNKVEELNHSNRELEEFAYVASHDIQEPLRKITTFSDRLSEKYKDVLTGDGAMYLSRIIASAENMRMLINELLEFSRISKTEQPFEKTNLNFILRQVKTDLELTIEETGTVIYYPELPVIDAIASQMKQLFANIITNAIKFHKPGVAPVITIETKTLTHKEKIQHDLTPNAVYHKVEITDNGIGFEEEYATRIFQVFQRLHGKSEYPGSGIGLAICKKILEYHRGIIYADNIPGRGARFVFILPQQQQKNKGNNI